MVIYLIDFNDPMQDQGLEVISEGLDTLKNMASDMNEVRISVHCIAVLLHPLNLNEI